MTKLHAIKSYFASVYNKNYSQDQLPLLTSMSIVSAPTFGLTLLEGIIMEVLTNNEVVLVSGGCAEHC